MTFTITNPGASDLIGMAITKDGADAADFTVTTPPSSPVPSGGSTTFTMRFAPTSGATGIRSTALHIGNNVSGKNPYHINLTGQALSFASDTDGDGMSDASEFNMAALGFIWQVGQPDLVNLYKANANGAGYYSLSQVQALHVDAPVLTKDPVSGQFKLTIGIEKSADLGNFTPFPFVAPQTSVNSEGRLEFLFTSPDNAAFFRLQAK